MPLSLATIRQLRRAVIVLLAVATTVLAVVMVVHALSPTGLGLAPTSQLLAILMLLTLPACTIAAWAWDRSVRKRTAAWAKAEADMSRNGRFAADREIDLEADLEVGSAEPRVHPAGRTKPHEAPAQSDDVETPIFLDQGPEPRPITR